MQYKLWLAATSHLPRAWRSSLVNVEHQLVQAKEFPFCRIYAEDQSNQLVGYIGSHPPFDWKAELHGPPYENLGWAIPFGFPWTWPRNTNLAERLYREQENRIPEIYSAFRRDIYIQRFRESWSEQLDFLRQHGWVQISRAPLLGKSLFNAEAPPTNVVPATRGDFEKIGDFVTDENVNYVSLTAQAALRLYDQGWINGEYAWRYADRGIFVLDPRGRYVGVTYCFGTAGEWDNVVNAAMTQAAQLGGEEVYFTVTEKEQEKHSRLSQLGFREVDAGIYMARRAD